MAQAYQHQSYLKLEDHRYLKVSALMVLGSFALYFAASPATGGNGGTWVGYALGTLGATLIFWLMWLGVRKRTYKATGKPLREWVSAHVYLGLALVIIVPIHSGFQVGWNVHTLAYGLMCAVIASGVAGVMLYAGVPPTMTENRPGEKMEALLERIATLDSECRSAATGLPDVFARAVLASVEQTEIGGGLRDQLATRQRRRATREALAAVRANADQAQGEAGERVRQLVGLLALKDELLQRVHIDVRLKALLDLWLVLHVPLAFATVAALIIHVFVVFYYR